MKSRERGAPTPEQKGEKQSSGKAKVVHAVSCRKIDFVVSFCRGCHVLHAG